MPEAKAKPAPETSLVTTEKTSAAKSPHGPPYELDPAQVERAAAALVKSMKKHVQSKEHKSGKKDLAADEDGSEQDDTPIFLTLTTKQHVKDADRLKPAKIALPHPAQGRNLQICLITADPQRQYKDIVAHPTFPADLRAKIGRVVGLEKLKKKYKTFETRRQLLAEYDIFLADNRIVTELPRVLGKVFEARKQKRPMPIVLAPQLPKDKDGKRKREVRKPHEFAKEIESALSSTHLHLSPSATTSIRVGRLSQTPEQLKENIGAVVSALATKFVSRGWKNIRALYIKGPTTVALPIWLADELWTDELQVLEEPWKPAPKGGAPKTSEKKRKFAAWEEELLDEDDLAEKRGREKRKKGKKSKGTNEPNNNDKEVASISKERRMKLKREALKSVRTPLVSG